MWTCDAFVLDLMNRCCFLDCTAASPLDPVRCVSWQKICGNLPRKTGRRWMRSCPCSWKEGMWWTTWMNWTCKRETSCWLDWSWWWTSYMCVFFTRWDSGYCMMEVFRRWSHPTQIWMHAWCTWRGWSRGGLCYFNRTSTSLLRGCHLLHLCRGRNPPQKTCTTRQEVGDDRWFQGSTGAVERKSSSSSECHLWTRHLSKSGRDSSCGEAMPAGSRSTSTTLPATTDCHPQPGNQETSGCDTGVHHQGTEHHHRAASESKRKVVRGGWFSRGRASASSCGASITKCVSSPFCTCYTSSSLPPIYAIYSCSSFSASKVTSSWNSISSANPCVATVNLTRVRPPPQHQFMHNFIHWFCKGQSHPSSTPL